MAPVVRRFAGDDSAPRARTDDAAPALYRRDDVARFGQFAVEPSCRGRGLAAMLLAHVEARARETGARELACDTAESAASLIALYERRGFRVADTADWRPSTNYRVVLSKEL